MNLIKMEHQKSFLEVVNTEKQMLALIYTKGILHSDVLKLYRQIRDVYEEILLNSNHLLELQEVEHHMWKLHYELIDGFRKRPKRRSHNGENTRNNSPSESIVSQRSIDKGLEEFKSFLFQAAEFYRNLIVKLRRACGLPSEVFLDNKDRLSSSIDPKKLSACQHTCHRLLICLGDLARYAEIMKKPGACEWSSAAVCYLEASRTWPDSGNPHNQLALLATYIGDAFLALYHCIRSLAVKEPFPDAWRNIMLLFEENRSIKLPSVSNQMQLDFLNPTKRSYLENTGAEGNGCTHRSKSEDLDSICSEKFDLWPILVRTISFLLISSSLEEYPSTLASALHRLDAMLEIDEAKLTVALEAYQHMDSSRKGPYRAVQIVSIFIFIVHSLTESLQQENSTEKNDDKHSALTPLALAAIFICMGRITERCLKGIRKEISPLLPAVLVFVEWLAGTLDTVQTHDDDQKVRNAMNYFFDALVELLNQIEKIRIRTTSPDHTALWEDHELRGFHPLNHVHERLDFTTHLECAENYGCRNESRLQRVVRSAKTIMAEFRNSEKTSNLPEQEVEKKEKSVAVEEEEVILFKPITRRNSAPLCISKPQKDPEEDEWLRRATSLSTAEDSDSFSFCSSTSNSGEEKPLNHKDPLFKDSNGPPSLSGWVLSKTSSSNERDNGFSKQKLSPIDEIASTSFSGLSINHTRDAEVATDHNSTIVHDSFPYVAPMPSAPFLPDDASWLRGSEKADGILGAAPLTNGGPAIGFGSSYVNGYPPLLGMSSSEWLYHYRNSQNMAVVPMNAPGFGNEVSSFDLCDQWGNRLVSNSPLMYWGSPEVYPVAPSLSYGGEEQKREKMFVGYQRPFPYVCGVGMEIEEAPLLHYLKEKERQLQPPSQIRGPFMGN